MSSNAFLHIAGIKGESKAEYAELSPKAEWIDILDVNFNMHNHSSSSYGGGSGVGKADFGAISFVKRYDKSSPGLMHFCAVGKHIPKVQVKLFKSSGDKEPLEYITIVMEQCFITSVVPSGLTTGEGMEALGLSFAKFDLSYNEQDGDGKKVKGGQFAWDLKALQGKAS